MPSDGFLILPVLSVAYSTRRFVPRHLCELRFVYRFAGSGRPDPEVATRGSLLR